jgi:tetratricopeptide (TPR) repeat protein
MQRFFKELFHRRVPQVATVYAGALWGLVQFSEFATTRYQLPERLVDWVFFGMLGVLPAVLLIAWNHGAPGRDRWTRVEIGFAALNVLIVVATLALLGPRPKPPVETTGPVAAPAPAPTVVQELAPPALTKTLLFPLTPNGVTTDATAFTHALSALVAIDLAQDDRMNVETALDGYQRPYVSRFKRGGFPDAIGAPVTLLTDIADSTGAQYFVTGRVERTATGLAAQVQIYTVDPARLKREATVSAATLQTLADALTVEIRNALNEGSTSPPVISDDLPVASLTSENEPAVVKWGAGLAALGLRNDFASAIADHRAAIALDPTFALAHFSLTEALYTSGESKAALAAARAAQGLQFRLSESMRFALRSYISSLNGRTDEALSIMEAWAQAKPLDITAKTALAFTYLTSDNQPKRALAQFEQIAELDPGNPWARAFSVRLARQIDGDAAALKALKRLVELQPNRPNGFIELADLNWLLGDYERALPLRGDLVSPNLSFAKFLMHQGDDARAQQLIDDARQIARDSQQRALVVAAEIVRLRLLDDVDGAVALLPTLRDEQASFLANYELNGSMSPYANLVAEASGGDAARQWVRETLVSPESDNPYVRLSQSVALMQIAVATRDRAALKDALGGVEALARTEPNIASLVQSLTMFAQALLLELDGNPGQALERLQQGRTALRGPFSTLTEPIYSELEYGLAIARTARLAGAKDIARDELARIVKLAPAMPRIKEEQRAAGS